MLKQASQIIAVDISKETLEALSEKRSFSVANDEEGLAELLKHVRSFDAPIAVFEATGGYQRELIETLASQALSFARLNPARVRNFAKSEGVKAKTDPIDARIILCCLSEIQTLSRNKIVALIRIAPFNDDSGKTKKKRRIQEGRAKVRKCLYMATKTAAVHNPVIKEYVEKLRERGKPYNCAIVAGMRKLLLHPQSLLKKHALALAS